MRVESLKIWRVPTDDKQSMKITLEQSKNLRSYKPILDGLIDDFGYIYYRAILEWCGFLGKWNGGFWRVWIIKEGKTVIGICGLYSLIPGTKELWLGWFGIVPGKRNLGRGSIVLKQLEYKAKRLGCEILRTYVDKTGKPIPFYIKNGFKRVCSVGHFCSKNRLDLKEFESPNDHILQKRLRVVKG